MQKLTRKSKVIIQGISETFGMYYSDRMQNQGMNIVAGVSAGKGGEEILGIPVFDLVEEAIEVVGKVDVSLIFNPPYWVLDAALEGIEAEIPQLIIMTSHIPPLDILQLNNKNTIRNTCILGPGSRGIIIPGEGVWGTLNEECYSVGKLGLLSYGDGLGEAIAWELQQKKIGQSIGISMGTGEILCSSFEYWLKFLQEDEKTEAIVIVDQGMNRNIDITQLLPKKSKKPIVAYVVGESIPSYSIVRESAKMIASLATEPFPHQIDAKSKISAYQKAKIPVAHSPSQLAELVKKVMK